MSSTRYEQPDEHESAEDIPPVDRTGDDEVVEDHYEIGLRMAEAALSHSRRRALTPDERVAARMEEIRDAKDAASGGHLTEVGPTPPKPLEEDEHGTSIGSPVPTAKEQAPEEGDTPEEDPQVLDNTLLALVLPHGTRAIAAAWRQAIETGDWPNVDSLIEIWNQHHPNEQPIDRQVIQLRLAAAREIEEALAQPTNTRPDYLAQGVNGDLIAVAEGGDILPPDDVLEAEVDPSPKDQRSREARLANLALRNEHPFPQAS